MRPRKILLLLITFIIFVGIYACWKFYGPAISTPSGEFLYIRTGWNKDDVKKELISKGFIKETAWYNFATKILRYQQVKPGRYKVTKGMSLFALVRLLRAGNQSKVNLVITKLRTRESLAAKVGAGFECDSAAFMSFISNMDTLKARGLDTNTVMAVVMPFTYSLNWNSTPGKIFREMQNSYNTFWNDTRKTKADSLHLTPIEVSTLASIIDEETRKKDDKYKIASTYLNRLRTGMRLQADPTVKFAMHDFALKRVTGVHLQTESPYNTYKYAGLPPGPICTPSIESLDAVLDAPPSDYLYFVASSNFDGSSIFTSNLEDHMKYARAYQQELTRRMDSAKKANQH